MAYTPGVAPPDASGDETLLSAVQTLDEGPGGGGVRDFVLVVGEGELRTLALPSDGELVLGRDQDCAVPLAHAKVSRRHAVIRGGSPVTIADLGSTNGFRARGEKVPPNGAAELAPGDSVRIGPFTIVLLREVGMAAAEGPRAALVVADPTKARLTPIVARIAESTVSVLIRGETGVGKEVLARSMHEQSGRTGPLVALNCAAFSEALLESEMFGHERGAFSGAVQAKQGLLESAAGGTVLLDEVGELAPVVQAKLLRAIEARVVYRVGGTSEISLDVRFIAASHRDLRADVASGRFRQDLYYRLNGITLVIPPLRERRGAINALALEFLEEARTRHASGAARISPSALAALQAHGWPGNARELRTVIERAVLLAGDDAIGPEHLVLEDPVASSEVAILDQADSAMRDRIVAALDACAGNQTRAARDLGISRATLVNKLALYRIPRPRR